MTWMRAGRGWEIGTAADVAWITSGTGVGREITAGIPPVFAAYATVVLPQHEDGLDPPSRLMSWDEYMTEWTMTAPARHERALLDVLDQHSEARSWWLGYLDTGSADTVFPNAPRTLIYRWAYVLVAAGPDEAARWRACTGGKTAIPDLMFPADRSWLLTTLWDDDWTCIGGSDELVTGVLNDPLLGPRARRVTTEQEATPPAHQAY